MGMRVLVFGTLEDNPLGFSRRKQGQGAIGSTRVNRELCFCHPFLRPPQRLIPFKLCCGVHLSLHPFSLALDPTTSLRRTLAGTIHQNNQPPSKTYSFPAATSPFPHCLFLPEADITWSLNDPAVDKRPSSLALAMDYPKQTFIHLC